MLQKGEILYLYCQSLAAFNRHKESLYCCSALALLLRMQWCTMSVEIFGLTYLNYYLSLDVYASFHGSVVLSVCLSKKNFSMVAISKNVSIKSCHIFKKDNIVCLIFWIRAVHKLGVFLFEKSGWPEKKIQVWKTIFLQPLFYTFLEKWLQMKWRTVLSNWKIDGSHIFFWIHALFFAFL